MCFHKWVKKETWIGYMGMLYKQCDKCDKIKIIKRMDKLEMYVTNKKV